MEDNKKLELTDDQLDTVSGGLEIKYIPIPEEDDDMRYCECCGRKTVHFYGAISVQCSVCGKTDLL